MSSHFWKCFTLLKKDHDAQVNVNRDYVEKLKGRHDAFRSLLSKYYGFQLPLHVMIWEAYHNKRSWRDVELLLSKFPPQMAKQALLWRDGEADWTPLHSAAFKAPQFIIEILLELAPEAACLQNTDGCLPLHHAACMKNTTAVELLVKVYPRGLVMEDSKHRDPIRIATKLAKKKSMVSAMVRGLVDGLRGNCSRLDFQSIVKCISKLIFERYDCKNKRYIRQSIHDFIHFYEKKEDCEASEMLLRIYSMIAQSREPLLESVTSTSHHRDIVGNDLDACIFSIAVEYRLLAIINKC